MGCSALNFVLVVFGGGGAPHLFSYSRFFLGCERPGNALHLGGREVVGRLQKRLLALAVNDLELVHLDVVGLRCRGSSRFHMRRLVLRLALHVGRPVALSLNSIQTAFAGFYDFSIHRAVSLFFDLG